MSYLMNTYARLPVRFKHGKGMWLWDNNSKRYFDALAGIAVSGLGHAHPRLIQALNEQAGKLIHCSNLYEVPHQEELAEYLCKLSGMDKAFFCNSGAEANEAAIKLARLYGHQKGIESPSIIVTEKSFHGRTMATLTATGNRKVQAGFEPLMTGFARVPYNDLNAIEQVATHNKNIVAILVEPIQGEGGIRVPDQGYLSGLRSLCDRFGWLLMLDEVQTGVARTGKWFAYQHTDIRPDVITLAKGLGSGMPIGACLAAGDAGSLFKPGNHGSTFGGNPLACIAALTTLKVIEEDNLLAQAKEQGVLLHKGLTKSLGDISGVKEIRGQGLMIGIELDRPCADLVKIALDKGLLINVTAESVIRLLPALIISQEEVDHLINELSLLIRDFLSQSPKVAAQN